MPISRQFSGAIRYGIMYDAEGADFQRAGNTAPFGRYSWFESKRGSQSKLPLIPIAVETCEQNWRNFALTHRYARKRAKTQSIRQLIVGRIVARYPQQVTREADGCYSFWKAPVLPCWGHGCRLKKARQKTR
jgi:hypothetical protein